MFYRFGKLRKVIGDTQPFLSSEFLVPMAIEMGIFVIHPSPFLIQKSFLFFNAKFKEYIVYRWNDILNMLVLLRVLVMVKVILLNSQWASNRAQRIW